MSVFRRLRVTACLLAATALPLAAAAKAPAPAPDTPPRLIVAISVDQFSADLFAQYRNRFSGGFARLLQGAVFPSGYQSHAATETCPGHSTILTGVRPTRNGIVANNWIDQSAARSRKGIYCAEDETKIAADPKDYVASAVHLKVPTLGEWIKAAYPASRTLAVAGKDRAALMMGGHAIDQVYWWKGKGFTSLEGRTLGPEAVAQNAAITKLLASGAPAFPLPADCTVADHPVKAGDTTVGTGRFALDKADADGFRVSPRLDAATLDLAAALADSMKLGKGTAPDVLAVGVSATDYIGHATGTEGAEMCIQMHALDASLARFFDRLDRTGADYAVVLTADHGGFDIPERHNEQALPAAQRVDPAFGPEALGKAVAAALAPVLPGVTLPSPLLLSDGPFGDFWVNAKLPPIVKAAVINEARRQAFVISQQVAAVFTAEDMLNTSLPSGSPETWTLADRARASFVPGRSGDLVILLKRGVVPIGTPRKGYTATHGSPWDYDRRVPMLFWRKGLTGFEQPNPVETVDIAPTFAAWLKLPASPGQFDGRCLDLDAGAGTTCGAKP